MTNKKSFLIACSLVMIIALNNCMFLKSNDPEIPLNAECPTTVKESNQTQRPDSDKEVPKPTLRVNVKQTKPTEKASEPQVPQPAPQEAPIDVKETETPAEENDPEKGKVADSAVEATEIAENSDKVQINEAAASKETNGKDTETQGDKGYNNSLKDLQVILDEQISQLDKRQQEETNKVKDVEERETKKSVEKEKELIGDSKSTPVMNNLTAATASASDDKKGCDIKQPNLIQMKNAGIIENLGNMLNLNVSAPTIANSVSTTNSTAKAVADDSSVANTVQSVKSTTNADAIGENNSIAVSNVVGNTEANSNNLAADKSTAVTVVDQVNNGISTATASENSLAVSGVKTDQKSDTNTVAGDNSTAIGATQMMTNADSTAAANEGSVAASNAIANEKSTTNTGAAANSTAIGVTAVDTAATSVADATNKSLAQSVAESANTAKTTTVALDNSAAVGATTVNSGSNATAVAVDGGNAISTSAANSNVNTESVAKNNSASVVANTGGSQSNATSVSTGVAGAYENPLNTDSNATDTVAKLQAGRAGSNCDTDSSVKIPSILDTAIKITSKTEDGSNILDKVNFEKEKCGTLEDNKDDVMEAAKDITLKSSSAERTKEKEDRERLKDEERKLRDDNRRLRQDREDRKDRDRDARKEEERESRKSRKRSSSSKKRCDRQTDMRAPGFESGSDRIYNDDCELNQKVNRDFKQSMKKESKPDERFNDENMFRDNIKDYDSRTNDQRVDDDCTSICKKEDLGIFISSEIQDIIRGNFLFKCSCDKGTTDWYMYDSKTDKSRALSSTARHLLDENESSKDCDDIPFPSRGEMETGNRTAPKPNLQSETVITAPAANSVENDDDDEAEFDYGSKCGNFVSDRIAAAKRKTQGGSDVKMHSDLGDCFNKFIENKFTKLHNRLDKIKSKNTNYVKDLHKKQLRKQSAKVEDIVDKSADCFDGPELSGTNSCNPSRGGDNLRNIQANMNVLKRDLNINSSSNCKMTPEDVYFQDRNARDQNRFNEKLQSRFDDKTKCEDDRFKSRFANNDRYKTRDEGIAACAKKTTGLKSDAFITEEVGRIKNQNKDYLSKIKNMFGGCE